MRRRQQRKRHNPREITSFGLPSQFRELVCSTIFVFSVDEFTIVADETVLENGPIEPDMFMCFNDQKELIPLFDPMTHKYITYLTSFFESIYDVKYYMRGECKMDLLYKLVF